MCVCGINVLGSYSFMSLLRPASRIIWLTGIYFYGLVSVELYE